MLKFGYIVEFNQMFLLS